MLKLRETTAQRGTPRGKDLGWHCLLKTKTTKGSAQQQYCSCTLLEMANQGRTRDMCFTYYWVHEKRSGFPRKNKNQSGANGGKTTINHHSSPPGMKTQSASALARMQKRGATNTPPTTRPPLAISQLRYRTKCSPRHPLSQPYLLLPNLLPVGANRTDPMRQLRRHGFVPNI